MAKKTKILWWSAGATSAVACKIAIDRYGKDNVRVMYFDISSAHEDNDRFLKECQAWYGVEIEKHQSPKYNNQFQVIKKERYVNGARGAKCTSELKRKVRETIEKTVEYDGQIFGFEYTPKEIERAERIMKDHPHTLGIFPLIENKMSKENCLGVLQSANIRIPRMYELGYPNNNCIGCVKGGMGYWNKIRVDFPKAFKKMAKLERKIGRSCLRDGHKNQVFLDELDPNRGRDQKILVPDCGFFCGDDKEYI